MDFIATLNALKAKTGDNNSTLSKKTGIPYTTIDSFYKKGWENIKLSTLETLCKYFGITLDELVYGTIMMEKISVSDTAKERLCNIYDSLSVDGKNLLLAQAEFFLSREESEAKKEKGSAG